MLENRALEIIMIALVVLVLFGAKRLPDSARALGKSLRILKAETRALRDDAAEPSGHTGVGAETQPSATKAAPAPLPSADSRTRTGPPGAATQGTPDAQTVHTT